jgi:uncharacterized protein (DUF58 family)
MLTSELISKIRKIEIKSKGLSNQIFSGEYHSAFKGRGMSFSEVKEYTHGDDVRTIDWNVSARFNKPFVKVYEEERELTVMLLVDSSKSLNFGTQNQLKKEMVVELCATIAFACIQNNDKIGVLFFTDKIEKFIPPKKGKKHVMYLISQLLEFEPQNTTTNINEVLTFFTGAIKKRSTAFLISDFFAPQNYNNSLKIASKKHDMVVLNTFDNREMELPNVGVVKVVDNETGKQRWIDTSDKNFRRNYFLENSYRNSQLDLLFRKTGVDTANINTLEGFVKPLSNLFKKRGAK